MLIHDVLEAGAAADGHGRVALTGQGDLPGMSRAALANAARGAAIHLRNLGLVPGDRVAIVAERTPEVIATFLGASIAGVVYVPLDPLAGAEYWSRILNELGSDLVLARDPCALAGLPGVRAAALPLLPPGAVSDGLAPFTRAATDPAYILPTSGSTGTPKGVVLSHENALAFVAWAAEEVALGPADAVLSLAPFHFDLSVFDIYASLLTGARLVLAPPHAAVFPGELIRTIEAHQVSVLYTVPTALRNALNSGAFDDTAGSSLRAIVYAGEPFPVPALRQLMAKLPHVRFFNFFGPTETNVCLAERLDGPPAADDSEVPIGRPASRAKVTLVDEQGTPVPEGTVGEIAVDGPTVMLGYRTSRGFLPAHRPYRTGDFAVRSATGSRLFRGRRDDMVKVRGQRIELKAVERVLAAVPGVTEVTALALGGELVAVIGGCTLDEQTLRAACRSGLPAGSMPDRFHMAGSLPRLSNGKLDRQSLTAEIAARYGLCATLQNDLSSERRASGHE